MFNIDESNEFNLHLAENMTCRCQIVAEILLVRSVECPKTVDEGRDLFDMFLVRFKLALVVLVDNLADGFALDFST